MSNRDKNLLMVVGVLVLYAILAFSYRQQMEKWAIVRKIHATAEKKLADEDKLISQRKEWNKRYDEMQALMPVFPDDKDVDTYWLSLMDSVARTNNLAIARRQAGTEVEVGDVFELPIDCKDWEGSLRSLVYFLWSLNQKGAMLDIRQMFIRPSQRAGFLRGTFTLCCAYMRGDAEEPVQAPPAADSESAASGENTSADSAADDAATAADSPVPPSKEKKP
ncbi:MAG: hypothetical protein J5985_07820 [Kiritimatiellae bacterium]|nr:hypothetical protein [Kiritimatiellia bacterium]